MLKISSPLKFMDNTDELKQDIQFSANVCISTKTQCHDIPL